MLWVTMEIKQYFYSQIDTIITSTNPDTVYPSHTPHMVDMGCNKAKIKTNAKDIAMLDDRGFNTSTPLLPLSVCIGNIVISFYNQI